MVNGEDSDVTIQVKDRVFKVHRNIIRARSPVFFSMFKYDVVEKIVGNIDITDCEPKVFQAFLEFLYTGTLKNCSMDELYGLYYIMDKYQSAEGKENCVQLMVKNLSVENFCDIITLSSRYEDSVLLQSASQFFVENSPEILKNEKWLPFLKENPDAANKLIIKLSRAVKSKKEEEKDDHEIAR